METATAHILYPSVFFLDTYMWFFKKNEIILLKKKKKEIVSESRWSQVSVMAPPWHSSVILF